MKLLIAVRAKLLCKDVAMPTKLKLAGRGGKWFRVPCVSNDNNFSDVGLFLLIFHYLRELQEEDLGFFIEGRE